MNKNKQANKTPPNIKGYFPSPKKEQIKSLLSLFFSEKESSEIALVLSADMPDKKDILRISEQYDGERKEFILRLSSLVFFYSNEELKQIRLGSHAEAGNFLEERLSAEANENLYMVCLNRENHIIGFEKIAEGEADAVFADVDYIVSKAVALNARKVIIAHNHVSGYMKYSKEDFYATEKLSAYFSAKKIVLMEHFVFSCGMCHGILLDLSGEDRWRYFPSCN